MIHKLSRNIYLTGMHNCNGHKTWCKRSTHILDMLTQWNWKTHQTQPRKQIDAAGGPMILIVIVPKFHKVAHPACCSCTWSLNKVCRMDFPINLGLHAWCAGQPKDLYVLAMAIICTSCASFRAGWVRHPCLADLSSGFHLFPENFYPKAMLSDLPNVFDALSECISRGRQMHLNNPVQKTL